MDISGITSDVSCLLHSQSLSEIFETPSHLVPPEANAATPLSSPSELLQLAKENTGDHSSTQHYIQQLAHVSTAAQAVRSALASRVLSFGGDGLEPETKDTVLKHLEEAKAAVGNGFEDDFEIVGHEDAISASSVDDLRNALLDISDTKEFIDQLKLLPTIFAQSIKPKELKNIDCRHQDGRDVERDRILLTTVESRMEENQHTVVSGADLKYDGVVALLVSHMQRLVSKYCILDSMVVTRFARAIVNVGNRTNSGGEAYEVIMFGLSSSGAILITPDSDNAPPMKLTLQLDTFKQSKRRQNATQNSLQEDTIRSHTIQDDYGIVCKINCGTCFNLTDPIDLEKTYGKVTGSFYHTLALSLLDGKKKDFREKNRRDYEVGSARVVVKLELD